MSLTRLDGTERLEPFIQPLKDIRGPGLVVLRPERFFDQKFPVGGAKVEALILFRHLLLGLPKKLSRGTFIFTDDIEIEGDRHEVLGNEANHGCV